jgi:quinoprotein glucose dehydrogenase
MRHSSEIIIHFAFASIIIFCLASCQTEDPDKRIKQIEPGKAAAIAKSIEATVSPQIAAGFTLKLWGIDSLVADPVAIDIDDHGRIYYTRTNRQKIQSLIFEGIRIGRLNLSNFNR